MMSFEPEDTASTCLLWRLPSGFSGRWPCPVYELTTAPWLAPWGKSGSAGLIFSVGAPHPRGAESWVKKVLVAQSRPTLCNPMYRTPLGSSAS